jgi:ubiquinone/menaquinone biosynthesis C-methylase UbiE
MFLERLQVPVQQNNLYKTNQEAKNCLKGDLRMTFCSDCGFVYNAAFEPKLMKYSSDYNNTQEASGHFLDHLKTMKKRMIKAGVTNSAIVEVGCGKGYFLETLIEDLNLNNQAIGFDPSYEGDLIKYDGRLRFIKHYFDSKCEQLKADSLVCRHVIEHVPEPLLFLKEIKAALNGSKDCRLFFETPCVDWIFKTKTIWDFFYEHCSLFNTQSLAFLFRKAGYQVTNIESVFSDQYLWLEAKNDSSFEMKPEEPDQTQKYLSEFIRYEKQQTELWQNFLNQNFQNNKIAVWGAGAKGVTFVNLFDKDARMVECIIDVNTAKQNRYVAGTGHLVTDFSEIQNRNIQQIIVMNPNYENEIQNLLTKHNISAKLILHPGENT